MHDLEARRLQHSFQVAGGEQSNALDILSTALSQSNDLLDERLSGLMIRFCSMVTPFSTRSS